MKRAPEPMPLRVLGENGRERKARKARDRQDRERHATVSILQPRGYDGKVCVCGSAWWNASVTIDSQGRITGYTQPRCRECRSLLPSL